MAFDVELRDPGASFDIALADAGPPPGQEYWGMMTW